MRKTKNPAARASANRVLEIKTLGGVNVQNPTESVTENQSDTLAVLAIMRGCRVSIYHARVVCELTWIGGAL